MDWIFGIIWGFIIIPAILGQDGGSRKEIIDIKTAANVTNSREMVSIDVQTENIDLDKNGNFADAEVLKVSLQVSVIEGNIHVNGMRAKHSTVTAFHFHAEIDEIGTDKKILQHHTLPIVIRILVIEEKIQSADTTLSKLTVEAQIIEIYGKTVQEIDVTQVIIKLDSNKKEVPAGRDVSQIPVTQSKIKSHKPENDIDVHNQGGKLPKTKFRASKEQMDKFDALKLKPAMKPKNPLHAPKTSFGGKIDDYEHSICQGFYRLPFSVRLSIFLLITFIGLLTLGCCIRAFCCKPVSKGKKFNLDAYDNKCDFDTDMEAPPLDTKIPLEKQKLVIDA